MNDGGSTTTEDRQRPVTIVHYEHLCSGELKTKLFDPKNEIHNNTFCNNNNNNNNNNNKTIIMKQL